MESDLIETLWNVKSSEMCMYSVLCQRFNRDIVECKGCLAEHICNFIAGFNRDIVECKVSVVANDGISGGKI